MQGSGMEHEGAVSVDMCGERLGRSVHAAQEEGAHKQEKR